MIWPALLASCQWNDQFLADPDLVGLKIIDLTQSLQADAVSVGDFRKRITPRDNIFPPGMPGDDGIFRGMGTEITLQPGEDGITEIIMILTGFQFLFLGRVRNIGSLDEERRDIR